MILALGEEELVEAPGVASFFSCGGYTLDNLLNPEENAGVSVFGSKRLKIPPIIRPETLVLLTSVYFTFCLYSKMIQLG